MLAFEDRFSRQRRLVEVGPDGQKRLGEASARIAAEPESGVEREYLIRAGFREVTVDGDVAPLPFPHRACFESTEALSVAKGAWSALARIRAVLGLGADFGASA